MARIIIADDDEIIGEIACEALLRGGHAAGLVTDGRDALRVIRARKPDLIILDCNMPGMNGLLVLRELRLSPDFCNLPVLILTGRQSDKDEELAHYAGANDYMRKPFEPAELVFRVDQLLAKHGRAMSMKRAGQQSGLGRVARR